MSVANSASERSTPVTRRERTGIVALAVPNLEEPYFAELTTLLARGAEKRGLSILIQQTEGDHDREVDVANGVGLPAIDGLIHIPRSLTVGDLTRRTSPGPLVLLGEHIQVSPFTHISIDNRAAADTATEHLASAGCARVAFIGPRDARPSDAADQRYAGYRDAVDRLALAKESHLVVSVDAFTPEEGLRAIRSLKATGAGFDGVVCSNDSVAFGVLAGLNEAGVRVPGDVAVIGIDNVHASQFSVPALSSVAPDDGRIVEAAFSELERQIAAPPGSDTPVRHIVVDSALVVRASSLRASGVQER
ncbi:substrate-binding domain-containing protein [Pseudarthrobacter sp. SL88]|uniref:LacI family DNA-binding transcriptional regulator n=1 Tax=Micrococcaceae TaxID=1268 RepID=UPI0006F75CF8|nr:MULTISPECIES: substrate-binding domain-containing protein [Micrococcaceae]KQQ83329.1 transcriptional regulator [Arthrobacter sp. Leaf137]MCY1673361.1 substrate-binding domain-containing protein [Pseudarthrobacter sp. SL88]MDQ1054448.1 DNA-binding LacI/PurR family transcriptional regulator [Arthrobacter sp. SORGH_AS_0212]